MEPGGLPPGWEDVLAGLAGDLDAAEALLVSLHDGTSDAHQLPAGPWPCAVPPLSGLDDRQRATLRSRLLTLNARALAAVSRLSLARSENRRHRALLERAESPHDRPVYIDRRA